ncbi:MAG TPA: hypothetical protein DCZ48_09340 [Methylococcaceae bacterium]|nr:hypothetical protein [Methylococcaceae bacterium]
MFILFIIVMVLVLYLPTVLILWRNVRFSQPWKAIYSISAFPIFVVGMILNIWLADIYTPLFSTLFDEAREKGQVENIVSFVLSVPIAVLTIAVWYQLLGALDYVTTIKKQDALIVDKEHSTDFSHSLIWVVLGFLIVTSIGLAAAGFHLFFDVTIESSIYLGFCGVIGLFFVWCVLSARRRMRYSPEADAAFKHFVEEASSNLVAKNQSISQIAGIWSYGYPKLIVLFSTDESLRQAKDNGLINEIARNFAERVKNDSAFGKNKELFDENQGVLATADKEFWELLVKG